MFTGFGAKLKVLVGREFNGTHAETMLATRGNKYTIPTIQLQMAHKFIQKIYTT